MNIFLLDSDPMLAARAHGDKHVVKMILETAQILSTNLTLNGQEGPYRPTHKNHPCTVWARESRSNAKWLVKLGLELYLEYQHRYGPKSHKSGDKILTMPVLDIPDKGLTPFAMAMPEEYRQGNVVQAYRDYYVNEKADLMQYTNRERPEWA